MKIAVISDGEIPSKWAHSINTVNHANGFSKLGHNIKILAVKKFKHIFFRNSNNYIQDFYGINQDINVKLFLEDPRNLIKRFKRMHRLLSSLLSRFSFLNNILMSEQRITNYCLKKKIDMIYCRSYIIPIFSVKKNIPTIVEVHTNRLDKRELLRLISYSKNKYLKGLVTIHKILKNNYVSLGMSKNKILVLEDAVDIDKFKRISEDKEKNRKILKISNDRKIIMYCGSLKPGKGVSIFIQTAIRLNKYSFFLVGGSTVDINYWENQRKKQNILNLYLTGFVAPKIVPYYLRSADILLMLYDLEEPNMIMDINTTSPLKLFEYMASKRPIISTKIPTIEKIVTNNEHAILTNPQDVDEIVSSIERLLKNDLLANELAKKSYERVKEFTYYNRCKTILNHFFMKEDN